MDFNEKITIGSSFSIVVAICYIWGYWGAFNINILELINFTDLAKLAIFPLLTSLFFLLIGSFATNILASGLLPSGDGNNTPIGQFGLKYWRLLVSIQIICIALLINFGQEPNKWFIISFLIAPLSIPLSHSKLVIDFIPDPKLRNIILFLVFLLPSISFAYGRFDAFLIKHDYSNRVVDVTRSKMDLKETKKKRIAYLGRVGETDIMYESLTGTIIFTKQVEDKPLFFTPRHKINY